MLPRIAIALLALFAAPCATPDQSEAQPAAAAPRAGDEGVFFGPFVAIIDGDSLRAKVQGVVMEFRLAGIDAPERGQPYAKQSRAALLELVRDQPLVIVFEDVDRYGRIVGEIWVGNVNVNRRMVEQGAAWFYAQFAEDDSLYQVEQQAREAQRGLWALPSSQRIEPWVWRERHRRPRPTAN